MTQLTIRGFSEEISQAIRALSEREGISLNQAVLRLLRKGAGLGREASDGRINNTLDSFFGGWADDEVAEFNTSTADVSKVDDDFWLDSDAS